MQMGQSTTSGGQIKVQGPKGSVQRLFKGANGTRVGTGSGKSNGLDEGQWHVVKCVHTATRVIEYARRREGGNEEPVNGPYQQLEPVHYHREAAL